MSLLLQVDQSAACTAAMAGLAAAAAPNTTASPLVNVLKGKLNMGAVPSLCRFVMG
ncbi:Uncharacterised protein [Serratia fonticola]|uniref:Uncharacterized protein n=1 Tax=Serratia fonticola TaxID=47917 RepID=A0A4U9TPM8_SERFO|nr:Uncharacterised protein [Serratia fonticola]